MLIVIWLAAAVLRYRARPKAANDSDFALTMTVAILACAAALTLYVWFVGALMERYLMPLGIMALAIPCALFSVQIIGSRLLFGLYLALCASMALATAYPLIHEMRWNEAAGFVAEKQQACTGARIFSVEKDPSDKTPNTMENYNLAYQYMAKAWNMHVELIGAPPSRPADPACPDYYWADHYFAADKSLDTLKSQFLSRYPHLGACDISITKMHSDAAVFTVNGPAQDCPR